MVCGKVHKVQKKCLEGKNYNKGLCREGAYMMCDLFDDLAHW